MKIQVEPAYTYTAVVDRWVDGDTVWLYVTKDIGFRTVITIHQDFRLYGVDTPERNQPGHDEAVAFVNAAAPPGTTVNISTFKDPDKYGRWLGVIGTINGDLVKNGLAKPYFGGTKA